MKHAAAKCVPSTRCCASACDDTSIATVRDPGVAHLGEQAWSSSASGVVCETVCSTPVEARARPCRSRRPARRPRVAIASRRCVVGRLAVRPGDAEARAATARGTPWSRAAAGPRTSRTLANLAPRPRRGRAGVRRAGRRHRRRRRRARGRGRRSWPPAMHAKHAPGRTSRLSCASPDTSTEASPRSSSTSDVAEKLLEPHARVSSACESDPCPWYRSSQDHDQARGRGGAAPGGRDHRAPRATEPVTAITSRAPARRAGRTA